MRSARFGFREEPMMICKSCGRTVAERAACMECPTAPQEHRGSRMPDLLRECAADPLFADAAFREFAPLSEGEKEAFREKLAEMGAVIYAKKEGTA